MKLQAGQSMTEFIIVLPALLLLLFGTIQFALIYHAKTTLNYAAFEAVRAGTLNNAQKDKIIEGFARGLAPLYTHEETVNAVNTARDLVRQEALDEEFVCIERINPPAAAFGDFEVWNSDAGVNEIPNDNLVYRDSASGSGGISIQDANLLKLRITYCYPMYVPFVKETVRAVSLGLADSWNPDGIDTYASGFGSFRTNCLNKLRIPIQAQATMRMQSPVRDDTFKTAAECR